ncbi:MAG TPA: helix-turn-helix domain-containing protein [Cytophagaceae bacterium]|nr:helix-turn-helix domain-containing protein [Cytophagaceae bacterium]
MSIVRASVNIDTQNDLSNMIVEGKELAVKLKGKTFHCAMDITMDYIGGKWKVVVLWYLRDQHRRFSELKRMIPDITEKMLSLQLKQLEKDGIVGRKVYAEVPPKVEYYLTREGKSLLPVLKAIADWGVNKGKTEGVIEEVVREKKKKRQLLYSE